MKLLDKIIRIFENIICFTFLWLCTFIIFFQVANRYFFHFEIMGLGDLGLYIFIFMALISMAISTREKGNTSLDMFVVKILKNNYKKVYFHRIIINVISLILIVIFLHFSYKFMSVALKYSEYGTLIKWFNTSWLRMAVFVMGILIFYHLFYRLAHYITDKK